MKDYFIAKLSDINRKMAIHEGAANERLASQAVKILFQLQPRIQIVPKQYKKEFNSLVKLIEKTLDKLPQPGLMPVRIDGIYNKKAAKYVKMLISIEYMLDNNE